MSIDQRALLVELNISTWTANKLDRGKTDQILHDSKAGNRAGKFHKNLMAGTSLVKDLSDYAAQCRTWNNKQTLPWKDKGPRAVPTSLYLEYKKGVNERCVTFWDKVEGVVQGYEAAKHTARLHLGDLYNPDDYPHAEQVRAKYGWDFETNMIPKSGHFMVDVPAEELAEMQESCEARVNERFKEAMQEAWGRLHSMCAEMSKKLTENEDDKKKKRWHDSFISNPLELCALLSHLNVTNDPDLERARAQLEQTIQGADIETIKDSAATREALKRDVDSIIDQYEW